MGQIVSGLCLGRRNLKIDCISAGAVVGAISATLCVDIRMWLRRYKKVENGKEVAIYRKEE
jgi:predicted acylesterase/phospholipase RssA